MVLLRGSLPSSPCFLLLLLLFCSVALFPAHCLYCKALWDLLSAGVSLMGCNNTVPFSPAKVVEFPPPADERGPPQAALCVPVFCCRLISLAAPPHGCPNTISQQAPTSKSAMHGSCRKGKLQDVVFSYLCICPLCQHNLITFKIFIFYVFFRKRKKRMGFCEQNF